MRRPASASGRGGEGKGRDGARGAGEGAAGPGHGRQHLGAGRGEVRAAGGAAGPERALPGGRLLLQGMGRGGKRRGAVGSQPRGSEVGERSVRVPAGTRGVEKVLNCSCGVS